MIHRVRTGGFAVALLALAATAATPARAQFMPNVAYYRFDPSQPTVNDTTSIIFYGQYPFACGRVDTVGTPDSTRVDLVMYSDGCADTTVNWQYSVPLGVLPGGLHSMTVHMRVEHPGGVVDENEAQLVYFVQSANPPHPPPPPLPPPPVTFMPYVSKVIFDPVYPNLQQPTAIDFTGWSPFPCFILDASQPDSQHLNLTLMAQNVSCPDTTQTWMYHASLGLLPAGPAELNVHLRFEFSPDSIADLDGVLQFYVYDTPAGPPPPAAPPNDSLAAALSQSRPNPFADQTEFGVTLDAPARAEVAIFDVGGRRVATVFDGMLARGTSRFMWNGRDDRGQRMPGGIYFYRLSMSDRIVTRRVVMLGRP